MGITLAAALAVSSMGATAAADTGLAAGLHLVPGDVHLDRGPDGNTVVIEAPDGLILFDTGRHPEHADAILAKVTALGQPVAAIVNSHWHFDHTTGNIELRAAFPHAEVLASRAVDGDHFREFVERSHSGAEQAIRAGRATSQQAAEFARAKVAHERRALQPTRSIERSGSFVVGGRVVEVGLAPHAVTEGDIYLYDPASRTLLAGDLVVALVPFMDTACITGWRDALAKVEAVPFETLIPGHGFAMSRAQFVRWKTAFERFVECGLSDRAGEDCVAGWQADAATFIDEPHRDYVQRAARYYLETRLRAPPEERDRYCARAS